MKAGDKLDKTKESTIKARIPSNLDIYIEDVCASKHISKSEYIRKLIEKDKRESMKL